MTATQDYYDWLKSGSHWTDAKPVADMQKTLEGLGYTVYTIGNTSHLTANPPEDHTPFSHTGWPGTSPKGRVLAFDIMAKGNDVHDLANLARDLISAKDAGLPQAAFIKYINWTDESGNCQEVLWKPNHTTKSSTDKGHIHVSIRTDYVDSDCAAGWNPKTGGGSSPISNPPPASGLSVDGELGSKTITRWQQLMHTPVDGKISKPSDLVKAVQRELNTKVGAGLVVDGDGIRQDGKSYKTAKALQKYLGTEQDGILSTPKSECVKALQRKLNTGSF